MSLLDRRDGAPPHAEIPLDRAVHRRHRDDLAAEPLLGRLVAPRPLVLDRLDHGVDVGGGPADVDDDHVAGARPVGVEPGGEQLDGGEHQVGGGSPDQRRRTSGSPRGACRRSRGAGTSPGSLRGPTPARRTPIRGTTLSARTYGVPAPSSVAATSAWASTLPATTTGPVHRAAARAEAQARSTSLLPPSVPPASRTTSGPGLAQRSDARFVEGTGGDVDDPSPARQRHPPAGLGRDQLLVAHHADPQAPAGRGAGEDGGVGGARVWAVSDSRHASNPSITSVSTWCGAPPSRRAAPRAGRPAPPW